jgi:rhodanese-related sulfurtransferase
MKFKSISVLCLILTFSLVPIAQNNFAQQQIDLPKEKQTKLGLYVTSKEAYDIWKSSQDKVKILDVRTLEEYLYVGHAPMAWNIPVFFQTYEWDSNKNHFPMKPNTDFISQVEKIANPNDTILVTCRSGGRSAMAVNYLNDAGFKNVFNITDGFEGDAVKDPESVYYGQRMVNGWKNSGLPWTYKIDPELMLFPEKK